MDEKLTNSNDWEAIHGWTFVSLAAAITRIPN